jgi:transcriptional regulator with XRE-family HTH domain
MQQFSGGALKQQRRRKRLSRDRLAARSGSTATTIWRLETEQHEPFMRTMCVLAAALEVDVGAFFVEVDELGDANPEL